MGVTDRTGADLSVDRYAGLSKAATNAKAAFQRSFVAKAIAKHRTGAWLDAGPSDPDARQRAVDVVRRDPPPGVSPQEGWLRLRMCSAQLAILSRMRTVRLATGSQRLVLWRPASAHMDPRTGDQFSNLGMLVSNKCNAQIDLRAMAGSLSSDYVG